MPLSQPAPRREIHNRVIDMKVYAREDGLCDVEAHLLDRKPFPFKRAINPIPIPAGQPLHDLWIRLTVDGDRVIRHVEASSDITPYSICKEAEPTLSVLVGQRIGSGWSRRVKELLRGTASCTHLMEMLLPMATTTLQGMQALNIIRHTLPNPKTEPLQLDSCYAYSREREVVQVLWPEHYTITNYSS